MSRKEDGPRSPVLSVVNLSPAKIGRLKFLDVSINLPGEDADYAQLFKERAFSQAKRFDIASCTNPMTSLPHMLPSRDAFSDAMRALAITQDDCLLFYDQKGSVGACRAWWMSKVFGQRESYVLDGGLEQVALHKPALLHAVPDSTSLHTVPSTGYVSYHDPTYVADRHDVAAAVTDHEQVILDARSPDRFNGTRPEPRPGLASGHIPGSINVPYKVVLDDAGCFKDATFLKCFFENLGIPPRRPITSCGSGLTAATLTVALAHAGLSMGRLYDGSWAEWGQRSTP